MGGDYAPAVTVAGAVAAAAQMSDNTTLVLFGDRDQILAHDTQGALAGNNRIEIVHTTQVIEMGDHPAEAFKRKTDSSITRGFQALAAKQIDGFASTGSTGAMMVGSMFAIGQIPGILRPTIATSMSTASGKDVLVLDVGLNADCKPEVLVQYGIIGSIYARESLKIENPRVALLNIGEESEKGNLVTKATFPLMKEAADEGRFNFVGNVEGKHIFTGEIADVVVCDGFSGNNLLKVAEGFYKILTEMGVEGPFLDGLNYESVGGTPVLGIGATVIIGHGCSTAKAITNMILLTERTARTNIVSQFQEAFSL